VQFFFFKLYVSHGAAKKLVQRSFTFMLSSCMHAEVLTFISGRLLADRRPETSSDGQDLVRAVELQSSTARRSCSIRIL